jgi:hypothetical protein
MYKELQAMLKEEGQELVETLNVRTYQRPRKNLVSHAFLK